SPDGTTLLVNTDPSLTLRDAGSGRILWSVPKALPDLVQDVQWSPDGRALLLSYGLHATEVLELRTGERLAWCQALRRVVTPVHAEAYHADLLSKGVAAEKTYDYVPLPQPDEVPPEQSLARILQRTGLEFQGVELVASPCCAEVRGRRPGAHARAGCRRDARSETRLASRWFAPPG